MKFLFLLLIFMSISFSIAKGRDPGDSPTPFPLNQAPSDLVGIWASRQQGEEIIVKHIHGSKDDKDRLFVKVYVDGEKLSQGFLYFEKNMYCGFMHRPDASNYSLCIWKQNDHLESSKLVDGQWGGEVQYYQ